MNDKNLSVPNLQPFKNTMLEIQDSPTKIKETFANQNNFPYFESDDASLENSDNVYKPRPMNNKIYQKS